MRTKIGLASLTILAAFAAFTPAQDSAPSIANESETLAFLREHHPELAQVLEPLKAKNLAEYRKGIGEIALVARTLADQKSRNPQRAALALEVWKTKSRVQLLAAQLAGSPSEELRSQLRLAIEAKLDAEVHRQKFELEQAEATARKLRESLDRLENHREAVVETRYRALQPKKKAKGRPEGKAIAVPASPSPTEIRP